MARSEPRVRGTGVDVSAILDLPGASPQAALVLAHGAGAGMHHPFMAEFAAALVARNIAVLRYQFPYLEAGRKRVDPPPVAHAAVRAAVATAAAALPGVPLLAGGKSFGGRMTSEAQAASALAGVKGLVFAGFPLHPPDRPGTTRADHLAQVRVPMLFLQGTRDEFARRDLLEPMVAGLGERARLAWIEDGDHSFAVRKKVTGKGAGDVLADLARLIEEWARDVRGPE
jgi:predicted alpha/beta-hydrolase family hydrolase